MIKIAKGDASRPYGEIVIAHIVNNIGRWGAGFSGALERRYPGTGADYQDTLGRLQDSTSTTGLGYCLKTRITDNLSICHMVAMRGVRGRNNPVPLDYDALRQCLNRLANSCKVPGKASCIQLPKIGAGLAGGDWSIIYPIIVSELGNLDVPVTILEL